MLCFKIQTDYFIQPICHRHYFLCAHNDEMNLSSLCTVRTRKGSKYPTQIRLRQRDTWNKVHSFDHAYRQWECYRYDQFKWKTTLCLTSYYIKAGVITSLWRSRMRLSFACTIIYFRVCSILPLNGKWIYLTSIPLPHIKHWFKQESLRHTHVRVIDIFLKY